MITSDEKKYIGIIGAMDEEVADLISDIKNLDIKTFCGITYYSGSYGNHNIVVAKCGIGKVFAAMCTTAMILNYDLKCIIHIGIAGSLDSDLKVHDVAIASAVVQHDFDLTANNMELGFIQGLDDKYFYCDKNIIADLEKVAKSLNANYKIGVIASGDQFINSNEIKKKIINNFKAIACEMEGASTGQVCYVNKIPFAVIRSFSDIAENYSNDDYSKSKLGAADIATKLIKTYLTL